MKVEYKGLILSLNGVDEKDIPKYIKEALSEKENDQNNLEIALDEIVITYENKDDLNNKRDKDLKGFVVDDIFLNKEIIKDMAVKFTTMADDEVAFWIDVNNQKVELTKIELGALVKKGTQTVEGIYFKYRTLKDELEAN